MGPDRRRTARAGRTFPTAGCPFCVGGLEAPDPYEVRAFENRWPPLRPGPPIDSPVRGDDVHRAPPRGSRKSCSSRPTTTRRSRRSVSTAVMRVVDLWIERTEALLARPEIEYVLVFENRGAAVGATIHHPHGQIYGYPFVPPHPRARCRVPRGAIVRCARSSRRRRPTPGASCTTTANGWRGCRSPASSSYGVRLAPRAPRTALRPRRVGPALAGGDAHRRARALRPALDAFTRRRAVPLPAVVPPGARAPRRRVPPARAHLAPAARRACCATSRRASSVAGCSPTR